MYVLKSWFPTREKSRAERSRSTRPVRSRATRFVRLRFEELESRLAPANGITLFLDPASDTGASSSDGVTKVTWPTFDVQVDQAGTIAIDFDGNGTADASQAVGAAGTYPFTALALADGSYTARATFTPAAGSPAAAAYPFTIDTTPPRLLPAPPAALGANLIVNGDVEAGAGSPTGDVVPVPGWTAGGNFTAVQYNASGGFPAASDPGPSSRGANFFAGGPNTASSSATQVIDVSAQAAAIDTGTVIFELSGYLGGFGGQNDNTMLTATFENAGASSLGTAAIGPVTPSDRSGATGLVFRFSAGIVPVSTRLIGVRLQMTRTDGSYNDGYADNLSLKLLVNSAPAAPLSSRGLVFSEPIDPATVSAADFALQGPGIAGSRPVTSVNGSGTAWTVGFDPLATPGLYTLLAGPQVADLAGNLMDGNGNGTQGEAADANPDYFNLLPDVTPPSVVSVTPSGLVNHNVGSLRVIFSEPIQTSTFTSTDVTITGPSGPVNPGAFTITPVNATTFDVSFPAASTEGTYNYAIGPDIADLSGNLMAPLATLDSSILAYYTFDAGTAVDDSSHGRSGTFSVSPPTAIGDGYQGGAFEFGASGTNTFITIPLDINPAALPGLTMGAWVRPRDVSGVIRGILSNDNGGFDRNLDLDTRGGSGLRYSAFTGSGVLGGPPAVANTWVFLAVRYDDTAGTVRLDVDSARFSVGGRPGAGNSQTTIGRNPNFDSPFIGSIDNVFFFNRVLSDSELDVVHGMGESLLGTIGQGAYHGSFRIDKTGPSVTSMAPSGAVNGTVSSVDVTFSEAIDPTTLTSDDVSLTGPQGAVTVSSPSFVSGTTYRFTFAPQSAAGAYNVAVGPNVADPAGNLMDQNGNHVNGEAGDVGRFAFTIVVPPSVAIVLDAASDSGASNHDGLTGVANPVFDVQVNQAGTITVDFDGNGTTDANLAVAAAGTYPFTAAKLGDGAYTARATFTATAGGTAQSSTAYTIDTAGARVTSLTPSGTIHVSASQATVTFSEPVDLGTFTATAVTLSGPGGLIPVSQAQLVSGSTYSIAFANQITSGVYTLTIAPGVADLAGNKLNQNQNGVNGEPADAFTGTFTMALPVGGPVALNVPTLGFVPASQVDDWTFFGRAGQAITAVVDPGAPGTGLPPPALGFAQVSLVDANGNVLGTAANTQAGATATVASVTLPADGTYHVRVQAPAAHAGGTGFYNLTVADATVHRMPLTVNTTLTGQLLDPYSTDQWTFATAANQQVQFSLVNVANGDIAFDLTGPNGYTAFSGVKASSSAINLPATGAYTLTVRTTGQAGAYAFKLLQTAVTDLTLNTPRTMPLAGSGQSQLFDVMVGAANPLAIKLTDANVQDQNEVYVSYGQPPTRNSYDYRFTGKPGPNQSVALTARPGTYYVLVYNSLVKSPGTYTVEADSAPFLLSGMTPGKIGNAHDTTLLFSGVFPLQTGNGGYVLSTAPTVQLVAQNGTLVPVTPLPLRPPAFGTAGGPAGGANPDGTMTVSAVLPGGLVLPGTYSVRVTDKSGYSQTLANALTVVQGGLGVLQTNVIVPNPIGFHEAATIYVQYSNVGDAPLPAPLLVLTATQNGIAGAFLTLDPAKVGQGFWTSATPDGFGQSVQFLASGAVPGVLQPGESESVPVYYAGWIRSQWDFSRPPINFSLGVLDNTNTQTIDWASLQNSLRPASLNPAAWNALFPNLATQLGVTWGNYVQQLDSDAQYLAGLGETVTDIGQLFNFEVQQANGYSPLSSLARATDAQVAAPGLPLSLARTFAPGVIARNQFGRFGWGWSDSWSTSFTVDADGSVNVLGPAGSLRRFQPDSRGGYFAQPGDHGTLKALPGGGYTLTELNGQVTAYNANGTLNYVQDTNGNRMTASYTGGLLTKLTHSAGQSLTLAYNAASLVASITDSAGRTTTYHYDATNQYLTSVVDFDSQTTRFTYDTGSNPATAHALLSVTHSDGSHDYFGYDARGRLADAHRDGGAADTTFGYSEGQVAVTDATNAKTAYSFDNRGLLVQVENPLHNSVHYTYDSSFNLTQTTDAAGQVYTNTYDTFGDLLSSTDPLGHTVHYVYQCDFDRLAAVTDGNGNTTHYGYDGKGNLTSTTYADGTVESVAYDPVGNVLTSTDRMRQATHYTHDAAGNILTESFADGTQSVFTYDAHENLTSATDASGPTILTYDANDRLTQITYASGRYLKYSYDAAGRRTQMVDQTGFTVNYGYDAVGKLATLTDGSGNRIVQYTYDTVGRLSREDKGNGTYTTYVYDAAGELLHLVNYAPNGTVNSRFDYTYDSLGRRITEATVDGTWTYSYDAISELTHAVFTSANPAIANQDLAYVYDAAGNRTRTEINGVTTVYTTNDMNEYTQVGDTTYAYNADGDMTSATDASGTTNYAYNMQNQLVGVTGPSGSWTYQYDAFGSRVATSQDGLTTQYLIDPTKLDNVVASYNRSGVLISHYTYGLGLVSQVDASATALYYDFDAIGSTVGITGVSGVYTSSQSYLPFGETLTTTGSSLTAFQFIGKWGTMTTGIFLSMGERFFSPTLGRFTRPDPIGILGGVNVVAYAANSPTDRIDPSGLASDGTDQFVYFFSSGYDPTSTLQLQLSQFESKLRAYYFSHYAPMAVGTLLSIPVDEFLIGKGVSSVVSEFIGGLLLPSVGPTNRGELAVFLITSVDQPPEIVQFIKSLLNADVSDVNSTDPNAKVGPAGYGTPNFVSASSPFPYRIDFENDPTATAPAQRVDVTDQLDPNLDWSTFQWTGFGFGNTVIAVPPNTQHYATTLPMTYNGVTFRVVITLDLDPQTGMVHASFQSLNAANVMTGPAVCPGTLSLGPVNPFADLPPDVTIGFLQPEDGTGRGMGYLTYTVKAKAGLVTGTQVRNVASVTFDLGNTIATDQVSETDPSLGRDPNKQALVTIDAVAPNSSVAPLPPVSLTSAFTVAWSGTDDAGGSGVGSFAVYVSDNGGPFTAWLTNTTQTSAVYTGQGGHGYAFYSVATDNAGNRQPTPATAQATTTVQAVVTTAVSTNHPQGSVYGQTVAFTATVGAGPASGTPTGSVQFQVDGANVGSPVTLSAGKATFSTSVLPAGTHTVTAVYSSDSIAYGSSTGSVGASVTPAPLTVTADNQSATYGAGLPALTVSYAGFVNNDDTGVLSGSPSVTTTATSASNVGSYPITVAAGSLAAANYTFTFVGGTLTVTPAVLTVTANNANRAYGADNPTFSAAITGFVNGDGQGVVHGAPGLTTTATVSSPVGTYAIVAAAGSLTAANYTFAFANGTLTVTQATPSVVVADAGGLYTGQPYPASVTMAGVLTDVDDTPSASLEGVTPTLAYYSGSAASGPPLPGAPKAVGTYTAVASFAGSADYAATTASTTFVIGRAAPVLSVSDAGGTFNGQPFPATATVAGVVAGVDATPGPSLEGVGLSIAYYAGNTASGTPLPTAPTAAGTYTVVVSFPGGADYAAGSASTTFTVGRAAPALSVNDAGGTYNGQPFPATATVAGVVPGVDTTPAAKLEGVSPSLTYYAGATADGTALAGSPSKAGTYTVVASFAGSADYGPASASTTFMISPATPNVTVTDAGGKFTGQPFPATATVAGVVPGVDTTPAPSLEGVSPTLAYYTGSSDSGTALPGAPSAVGTYTVVASFAGSADYTAASASTTFVISASGTKTTPKIVVTDAGGTYNGQPFPATATITGTNGQPGTSLEGVGLTLAYYAGTRARGTPLPGAPTAAGTYTVVASFAGSANYNPASAITTFTITQATPAVVVADAGGTYNGQPFPAAVTVAGVSGTPGASLENVAPTLTYYSLANGTSKKLSGAPAGAGSYMVVASFAGSTDYTPAGKTASFAITTAAPRVAVVDAGGNYTGKPFPATATVVGVVGTPSGGLEGVKPTLTYYALGSSGAKTLLPGAPTAVGRYEADAAFAGSDDYSPATACTTFNISPAAPAVVVRDNGGTFNGQPFPAKATLAGVDGKVPTLEGVGLVLTYYAGSVGGGAALPGAPSQAGTYTVVASFAGSPDYAPVSAGTTFTVAKASPKVVVRGQGGTYSGQPFPATATVAGVVSGVDDAPAASLEGVGLTLTYYLLNANGTKTLLGGAPSRTGRYEVDAAFAGSADYVTAARADAFTIKAPVPKVTISAPGGTYNGTPFAATATVTGVDGTPSPSLEGVAPTLTYFRLNDDCSRTLLAGAPSAAGRYEVEASFAGTADYAAADRSVTFTIKQATPSFGLLSSPTVRKGTASTVLSGTIGLGGLIPTGVVAITVNGVCATALVRPDGTFAVSFDTRALPAGKYMITYSYLGDNNFNTISGKGTLTVTPS